MILYSPTRSIKNNLHWLVTIFKFRAHFYEYNNDSKRDLRFLEGIFSNTWSLQSPDQVFFSDGSKRNDKESQLILRISFLTVLWYWRENMYPLLFRCLGAREAGQTEWSFWIPPCWLHPLSNLFHHGIILSNILLFIYFLINIFLELQWWDCLVLTNLRLISLWSRVIEGRFMCNFWFMNGNPLV